MRGRPRPLDEKGRIVYILQQGDASKDARELKTREMASAAKLQCAHRQGVHSKNEQYLGMDPASLRAPVYENGKGEGRHALLHPLNPRLRKTSSPKYVPQEPPIYGIVRLGEVHLPQEPKGVVTAPCGDYCPQ